MGDWGTKIILVDKVNKISFLFPGACPVKIPIWSSVTMGEKSEGWMYKTCYVDLKHFKM